MAQVLIPCVLLSLSLLLKHTDAIQCFECDSSKNFSCTEFWDPSLVVVQNFTSDCSHVFEAEYCVKMTGVFEGKLGTKRFCSSRDWGNYCEYIKRPGDIQEYRSCVFSCTPDRCNTATPQATLSKLTAFIISAVVANQRTIL
eukprot:TRINITY_DN3213_c0_g1_i1.p1 TRINITY_DN3213_c0_g1~~TRINITY_DN3213_c0_g1_i1.p1  ORF type:complete len:142 (+),score=38.14 TRINITY_DN3213_c0_g1_i1:269-694(+)